MKFGVVVFPGSNCDHDAWYAVSKNLGQQAEFGNRVPMLSAPALLGRDDLAACFKIVLVTEEPLKAAPQKLLFVCKLNVHLRLV